MRLFGRKAADAARPMLGRRFGQVAGERPWSYERQLREAYRDNPVAQRAVRLVAEGVADVPVYAAAPAGEPAARLIAAPGLVEAVAAQLLLHGNAFLQVAGDAEGLPAALFALRPERVSIELDARGWPAAYLYRAGDIATRLPAADGAGRPGVIHLRALNPLDDHYGAGCLDAAAAAVAAHNAAARWNRSLLDNAARPSGALLYEPGDGAVLSAEQYERLKGELEASFQGAGNAGRPMLLEGGIRWQPISMTPAEMDFAGLKAGAARDIALAFGVPPMILGLPGDNTYANYAEANRALWRLTIVPLAARILRGVAEPLRAWWPELDLKLDLDALPALSADRAALWEQLKGADFLSADEKREMLGFGPMRQIQKGKAS